MALNRDKRVRGEAPLNPRRLRAPARV